jgi:hypothetical protein
VAFLAANFFLALAGGFFFDDVFVFAASFLAAGFLLVFFLAEAAFRAVDFFRVGFFLLAIFFLRAGFFLAMGKVYQNNSGWIDLNPLWFRRPSCFFVSFVVKVFGF